MVMLYSRKAFLMLILNFEFVWPNFNFWAGGGGQLGVTQNEVLQSCYLGLFCIRAATAILENEVEHGAMSTLTIGHRIVFGHRIVMSKTFS